MPSNEELIRRVPRLILGLALFGFGIALMVLADLGLSPWEVLHQGISRTTGVPIGTVGIITGILVLLLWIPLRERVGIGTLFNVLLIGIVIDLTLWLAPIEPTATWHHWVLLIAGMIFIAVASGMYIGVGLGPGPRDGLMTGIGKRGVPIGLARGAIELTVLGLGFLLGGRVGIGTVLFAFGIGPLVGWLLPVLTISPIQGRRAATVNPAIPISDEA
jgi:uncharacterized membrane protein YczE